MPSDEYEKCERCRKPFVAHMDGLFRGKGKDFWCFKCLLDSLDELEERARNLQNILNYVSQRAKKNTYRDKGHFCQHRTNCEAIVNIIKDCQPKAKL